MIDLNTVPNPNKRKGDKAERDLAALLTQRLGTPIRRMLGAGRQDDIGDLDGLPNCATQVKHWQNITAAITTGIAQMQQQQINKNAPDGVLFIKHRKHGWLAVTTLEQWTRTENERRQGNQRHHP